MSESDLERLVAAAGLADDAEDFVRAAALLEEVVRRMPDQATMWAWLGDVYAQMERFAMAEDAFVRAIQLDGSVAGAHSGLGRVFQETGRDADAAREFTASIALDPTPSRLVLLARSLAALGDVSAARAALQRALAADAHDTEALLSLAQLERAEDPETALALVQRALSVEPHSSIALRELGGLLGERGYHAEAVTVLRESATEDPSDSWTKVYLGNALESLGLLSEAEGLFIQASELSPLSGTMLQFVSDFYQRRGRFDSAEAVLRRAASFEPDNADIAKGLAAVLRATGREREAQWWTERARALNGAPPQRLRQSDTNSG